MNCVYIPRETGAWYLRVNVQQGKVECYCQTFLFPNEETVVVLGEAMDCGITAFAVMQQQFAA